MIFLTLFWEFFQVGLFTIGGGYAMYPLIRQTVLNYGWLTENMLANFVGIAEGTPGPFAINLATFVGMQVGNATYSNVFAGFLGATCATLGVVMPSFIIIIVIAKLYDKFSRSNVVKGVLYGARPAVLGLILSVVLTLSTAQVFPELSFKSISIESFGVFSLPSLVLIAGFVALSKLKIKKKKLSPIILILFSALVGIIVFGVFKL